MFFALMLHMMPTTFLPIVDKEIATNLSEFEFSLANGNYKPYFTYNVVNVS